MSTTDELSNLRATVVEAARRLEARGLTYGTAGNISLRVPRQAAFLVTPSGIPYDRLMPDDIVLVSLATGQWQGRRPSVETPLHAAVLGVRPDLCAVIHTHSTYASAVAAANLEVPPILDAMGSLLGGSLELAPYAASGSEEMTRGVLRVLARKDAVLLANHGAVVAGQDMPSALAMAEFVEHVCRVFCLARQLGGAVTLPLDEVARLREWYLTSYGQRAMPGAQAADDSGSG